MNRLFPFNFPKSFRFRVGVWLLPVVLVGALSGCGGPVDAATPIVSTATATALPTATPTPPTPTLPPTNTPPPTVAPSPTVAATSTPAAAEAPHFATDVQPIFTERCIKCHSGDTPPRGLRLDSYEHVMTGSDFREVVVPGNPAESELIRRIKGISTPRMPFDGPPFLSDEQIATIEAWIVAGAPNN